MILAEHSSPLSEFAILAPSIRQFAPAPKKRMLDWAIRNAQNENGEPYNHNGYPHLGAPGGPCDAFDDPRIRRITLQFATRLGKTFFGQCACMFTADQSPAPMMFASSVEKVAHDVVGRTYTLLEKCKPLVEQLLREDLRGLDRIDLAHCSLYVAWSRSPSTLGDKNIKVGHGNELDKWERASTSKEADPLDLFLDRAKDFPSYKFILESTPSVRGLSRIEKLLHQSTACKFLVPCLHCKKFAPIDFHQIKWDRLANGKQDADKARETARYVCKFCEAEMFDHDRRWMMRMGVWCPAGCGVDHDQAMTVAVERQEIVRRGRLSEIRPGQFWKQDYVLGEPERDGINAGFQLSSLAALKLTWGDCAAAWVSSYQSPTSLQNVVNQWFGETWAPKKRDEDWEKVGAPLISEVPRFVAPVWSSLVTMAIDRQLDHYKYLVEAFGPGFRSHTMDFGEHVQLDWIIKNIVKKTYQHEDGGTIGVRFTLIDSGYDPEEPYNWVLKCLRDRPRTMMFPCKGSSTALGLPFKQSVTPDNSYIPGLPLIMVDGDWSQGELNRQLYKTNPGENGSTAVFNAPIAELEDFFRQLLNDHQVINTDKRGQQKLVWNKDPSWPNDFRDCKRYAKTAQLYVTGGRDIPARSVGPLPARVPTLPRTTMPDGRPFLATERR